jgi:hypothetical protein
MTSPKVEGFAGFDETSGGAPGKRYWDSITAEWRSDGRHALWRAHSDAITTELLRRWVPQRRIRRVLKTDLFDEAVSEGLLPFLAERADWVSGIDVSGVTATAAHMRYPRLGAVAADVRLLPQADGAFDVIFCGSTLPGRSVAACGQPRGWNAPCRSLACGTIPSTRFKEARWRHTQSTLILIPRSPI